jgi:hypothetical protein
MATEPDALSRSDERILRGLLAGDINPAALDWVGLQHLKQRGLVEETASGPKVTDAGKRALGKQPSH